MAVFAGDTARLGAPGVGGVRMVQLGTNPVLRRGASTEREGEELRLGGFGFALLNSPIDDGNFRPAVPTERQERPSETAIHVEAMPSVLVSPGNPASAAWRKPECGHSRNLPLPSMAMSAQDQVDGMVLVHLVEDVWRMGEKQGKAAICRRRDASKIGAMERRIIDSDDGQFARAG